MHKERIFSASSGRLRGASSGNMEPCPRRPGVVFPCSLLTFLFLRAIFPRFAFTGSAGVNGAQPVFVERAYLRARRRASLALFPGPGRSSTRLLRHRRAVFFFFVLCPASFSSFSPVRSGHLRVAFLLRLAERPAGGLPPVRCVAPRPVRRRTCALSSLLYGVPSPRRFLPDLLRTPAHVLPRRRSRHP